MVSKPDNQAKAILEIWNLLLQYRWRFITPAFLVMAAILAISLILPRKYDAQAIFERRTDMVLAEITSRGAPRTFQDPRQALTD